MTNCKNLTDASIVEVAACCSKLERLVVSGTNLTDVAVTHVACQCPRLAQFRAEWCRYLTGQAILEIAAHCPCVERLEIAHYANLTDEAIMAVVAGCDALQHLDVSFGKDLTDESILAVVRRFPSLLHREDVLGCRKLTRASESAVYSELMLEQVVQNRPFYNAGIYVCDCRPSQARASDTEKKNRRGRRGKIARDAQRASMY